jgi:hypothetical protein
VRSLHELCVAKGCAVCKPYWTSACDGAALAGQLCASTLPVSLKTAKTLGLAVPQAVLLRANRIIE